MILLDSLTIHSGVAKKRIELHQGDLSDLSPDEAVDILIVSAFPNDYTPTESSLIGALYRKGVSVEQLAIVKAADLRESFSCWLSHEIKAPNPGIQFGRILCFEALFRGKPPEVIGDIFQSLTAILGELQNVSTVAMPFVAAGNQGYSVSEIFPPLLDAAVNWMAKGIPLKCLKIVAYSDRQAEEAKPIFSKMKDEIQTSSIQADHECEYDVFISYAHEDANTMSLILEELQRQRPTLRIFLDRKDIDVGIAWQPEIFESLDKCRKVVTLLSPSYLNSKVCKEEFNIAWVRSREGDDDIMFPIYLYTTQLPTYMKYRLYADCREGDKEKLRKASLKLLSALDG